MKYKKGLSSGMFFIAIAFLIVISSSMESIGNSITGFAVYEQESHEKSHEKIQLTSIEKNIIDSLMSSAVRAGNEPYFIDKGNSTAVLMLHGLSASPWEVAGAAEYFAERNISVYAPLIAGHGTTPEDLKKTDWEDWYSSADDALSLLEDYSDNVYILGVSTGSDIAVLLARNHPNVKGLILTSPAIYLKDWKARYVGILRFFIKYVSSDIDDEEKFYYYDVKPVQSVYQLKKLAKNVRKVADEVNVPVLILQSLEDHTVTPEGAKYLFDNLGSEEKDIFFYEEGNHVLVRDPRVMDSVYEKAYNFVIS